jgi:trehalose-phosphatase
MSAALFEQLDALGLSLRGAPAVLLFLDFDGTLAPLVDTPEEAQLSPKMRQVLHTLASRPQVTVGIISGRHRTDLQARVDIPGLVYAGNQGLEISGPGFVFVEPTAVEHRQDLERLAADLAARLQPIAGVLVEDKGLTLSVHFRQVAEVQYEDLRRIVHAGLASASHPFVLTPGEKVYEIRPRVYWNKGNAVSWIRDQLGKHDAPAIYVGNDATDEDAFAALPEGITIKVGLKEETAARYHVEGPDDVQKFLEWLARILNR